MKRSSALLLLIIFIFSISCQELDKKKDNNDISLNGSGYPNVSGEYSFLTGKIKGDCTDGASVSFPPISFNLTISQSVNKITFVDSDTSEFGTPGWTFIEKTPLTGNVQKDKSFVATSQGIAVIDGVEGKVTVSYNLNGKFSPDGFSGNYTYSVFAQYYKTTCTYTTTFSGDKITSSKKALRVNNNFNNNESINFGLFLDKNY